MTNFVESHVEELSSGKVGGAVVYKTAKRNVSDIDFG